MKLNSRKLPAMLSARSALVWIQSEIAMPEIFLFIGLLLLSISALLYLMPNRKILNFVNYDTDQTTGTINRYAALRLLLPAFVFMTGSFFVQTRAELAVPLVFASIISVLIAVVWIAAGVNRLER
jgi:hypothetical protein